MSRTVDVLAAMVTALRTGLADAPEVTVARAKSLSQMRRMSAALPCVILLASTKKPRDARPVGSVRQNKDLEVEVFIGGQDPDDSDTKIDVYTLGERVEAILKATVIDSRSQPVCEDDAFSDLLDSGLMWRQVWKQWIQEVP